MSIQLAFVSPERRGVSAVFKATPLRLPATLQVKVQIKNPDEFLTPELSAKVDFLAKEAQARHGADAGATR